MTVPSAPVVEVRVADGVAWLTLNRPAKRNALNGELVRSLLTALRAADADPQVRVVAIEGAGKDFCAGADLGELARQADAAVGETLGDAERLAELFQLPRQLDKPVAAVVHGRALAGGCGLAIACDLVFASQDATFGFPEVGIGFVPAMVTALVRRNVGEKKAFELLCLGRTFTAAEAEVMGLVNQVAANVRHDASVVLERLAGTSASALRLTKRLLYGQDTMGLESALRSGTVVNAIARQTGDARAGIARFAAGER